MLGSKGNVPKYNFVIYCGIMIQKGIIRKFFFQASLFFSDESICNTIHHPLPDV